MKDEWLKLAPKEWREKYEAAANLPVSGTVRDCHGMFHEIIGDYTECNLFWADGADPEPGWEPMEEGTPVTCILCLTVWDQMQWHRPRLEGVTYLETSHVFVPADRSKP